jgi:hypothetical protein
LYFFFAPRLAKLYSFAIINHLTRALFSFFYIQLYAFLLISEKLLTSEGRELRRALFSLKQIFQEDKDLVHGFVGLGGLNCLVQIGSEADQNYQNYILRALGQVTILYQFIILQYIILVQLFCRCMASNDIAV